MSELIVSLTVDPGIAATLVFGAVGIAPPPGPRWNVCVPLVPASSGCSPYSSPPSPLPSEPTNPTTLAARSPLGYTRLVVDSLTMPGKFNVAI